jgi:hypothetical protein
MILLWTLCLPIAAVMLVGAIEWAGTQVERTAKRRRPINQAPARVLVFDVMRTMRSRGSQGCARECAQVIVLHESRRRSSRSIS